MAWPADFKKKKRAEFEFAFLQAFKLLQMTFRVMLNSHLIIEFSCTSIYTSCTKLTPSFAQYGKWQKRTLRQSNLCATCESAYVLKL